MKAVIFDVDGTLLNTERIYIAAWKEAGRLLGYEIPQEALLRTRACSHKDAALILQSYCGESFPYEAVRAHRYSIAEQRIAASANLLMPGVAPLLTALQQRGIPMAVASSTALKDTLAHLEHAGILSYFSAIVGGDMVARGKPNPDIFLKAAEALQVAPADCVAVEDTPIGVRAAAAAQMRAILVPDCVQPDAAARSLAHAVLQTIDELALLLDTL